MEWTLTGLFIVAILLFIYSMYKNKQATKIEQREIDTVYMTIMEEITKLQNEVQILNLENEILSQKAGLSNEERELQRKLLDLYKRNFKVEVMAAKLKLEPSEVEKLLAPYVSLKKEGRKVANES
ncbi:hypothetical protein [Lysinibacillus halotolerans]|uniref:DUF2802 domain-containing protein n=1 Tax=Lysinibacillus halotolerans TaxID=1368476 RepID=A0A3M8HFT0_9BACI|nr:hypothetical protein [Lysinibacillus halotolerans]RND01346.1 hypothetical protein EC501_01690 [Lysinibacillus halotolerans]